MADSDFIRIVYSDGVVSLNGLHLRTRLFVSKTEQYFNKYKCTLDIHRSAKAIEELASAEALVLRSAGIQGKTPVHKIAEQLQKGAFKLFADIGRPSDRPGLRTFLLKMSGVWETGTEFGVTHKFLHVHGDAFNPSHL
tara:strand:+ start:177 stop:590 length:414 start_codon:yes stop_codon:yes gene_type:complete